MRVRMFRRSTSVRVGGALSLALIIVARAGADDGPGCVLSQAALYEANQMTPDISTTEFAAIAASRSQPVLDVRSALEYAIAHVPGSINLWEKEVDRITQTFPDRSARLVLYCNGPYCGKSKRVSESLVQLGYTNVRRYQLGMPLWRALGNTVQTDIEGVRYIWSGDMTAIWVDARPREDYLRATLPGAVTVMAGEADAANEDGRLPQWDKGTRVLVFGRTPEQARVVAAEIARKAYWNSSFFGGTYEDLVAAALSRPAACLPAR
jgi:rhodanese-related sulfurtransferase